MPVLKCQNCGHEWNYKGKAKYATCPSCLSKVKVPAHSLSPEIKDLEKILVTYKILERGGGKISKKVERLIKELHEAVEKEVEKGVESGNHGSG